MNKLLIIAILGTLTVWILIFKIGGWLYGMG